MGHNQMLDTLGQYLSPAGILSAFLAFFGALPIIVGTVGGVAALVYYSISIYEKPGVQAWVANRRERKRKKRVLALRALQTDLYAQMQALGVDVQVDTKLHHDTEKTVTETKTVTTDVQPPVQ